MDTTLLHDLAAEHDALDNLVAELTPDQWVVATPSPGWSVADQIHHLTVSDRAAIACVRGRHDEVWGRRPRQATPRPHTSEVLAGWREARRVLLDALDKLDERDPVVWGAGPMSARSLTTARLMETWAHGLDCHAALGAASEDTDRLRHVAHLAHRTLPYAFTVAGVEPPAPLDELRIEVTAPDATTPWRYGRRAAPQLISGAAGEWCRVAVRRVAPEATTLRGQGALAEAALRVARCYLAM